MAIEDLEDLRGQIIITEGLHVALANIITSLDDSAARNKSDDYAIVFDLKRVLKPLTSLSLVIEEQFADMNAASDRLTIERARQCVTNRNDTKQTN